MESPIFPIVTNFFMEEFQIWTINTATNPPRILLRYVDENIAIQMAEHNQQFLQQINPIDSHIQFTAEGPTQIDLYPFWTLQLNLDWTKDYSPQSKGNLPTKTNTFIGTATTTFLLNLVNSIPLNVEHNK